jgi:hypothetical protein
LVNGLYPVVKNFVSVDSVLLISCLFRVQHPASYRSIGTATML